MIDFPSWPLWPKKEHHRSIDRQPTHIYYRVKLQTNLPYNEDIQSLTRIRLASYQIPGSSAIKIQVNHNLFRPHFNTQEYKRPLSFYINSGVYWIKCHNVSVLRNLMTFCWMHFNILHHVTRCKSWKCINSSIRCKVKGTLKCTQCSVNQPYSCICLVGFYSIVFFKKHKQAPWTFTSNKSSNRLSYQQSKCTSLNLSNFSKFTIANHVIRQTINKHVANTFFKQRCVFLVINSIYWTFTRITPTM